MKTINLHQVDSFTDTIFGGNPAGVVTDADLLSGEEMGKIAREMNLSETAFVVAPTQAAADVKFRYFTRSAHEIDFCGHATIATLFELARLRMHGLGEEGESNVKVETGAGVLDMAVAVDTDGVPRISFAAPGVDLQEYRLQDTAFAEAFGIPVTSLRPESTILIDRILNYLYVPIGSLAQLGDVAFDIAKIREQFATDSIIVFCLYTNETFDEKADLHARVTGPFIGIDEDPFTGSTQSGLVHVAKRLGMLDESQERIVTEQGNFMDRSGFAEVTHDVVADKVRITAQAAQVFSAKVEL